MNTRPLFVALLGAALVASAAAQLPVFFDDFLADNLGQPREGVRGQTQGDPTGFFLWTVEGGTVDLVGGNVPGAPGGPPLGRYVDLGGSTNAPGLFQTLPVTLTGAASYTLSFVYNSVDGSANSANVTVAGQTFNVATSGTGFQTFSRTIAVDPLLATTTIAFQDLGDTSDGIGIDTVSLIPIAAVPEPASMAALGVGALAFLRRRKAA